MPIASLLPLLIALVVVGAMLYLLQLIPMDAIVRQVVRVLAIVLLILYAITVLMRWARVA